jgi:hypothetical protein
MKDELLKDCIADIIEMAEEAKIESKGEFRDGKMLAYNEVLSSLKTYLTPVDPEKYGLGFDIDKKFA